MYLPICMTTGSIPFHQPTMDEGRSRATALSAIGSAPAASSRDRARERVPGNSRFAAGPQSLSAPGANSTKLMPGRAAM